MNISTTLYDLKSGRIPVAKLENGRGMSVTITYDNAWRVRHVNGRVSTFNHMNALISCLHRDDIVYGVAV